MRDQGDPVPRNPPRPPRPRQREVEHLLRELIGEGPRQFFSDGCRIAQGDTDLESASHMLAHCAREVDSAVRAVLARVLGIPILRDQEDEGGDDVDDAEEVDDGDAIDGGDSTRGNAQRSNQVKQIRAIVTALPVRAEIGDLWIAVVKGKTYGRGHLAQAAHRRHGGPVRGLHDPDIQRWSDLEGVLLSVLPAFRPHYVTLLDRVRELALLETRRKAHRPELLTLIGTYVAREVFYGLATPGWLPLLASKDQFDDVEYGFVRDLESGRDAARHSPALTYLARAAATPAQQRVFVKVTSLLDYPHEYAAADVLKGATALPHELRVLFVPSFTAWVARQEQLSMLGDDAAAFAGQLLEDGARATALELADAVLRLDEPRPSKDDEDAYQSRTPRARLADYEFDRALERFMSTFIAKDPAAAFAWAHAQLDRALELSESRRNIALGRDGSTMWRPSIADGGRHYGHAYTNALVDATRDAAQACAAANRDGRDPFETLRLCRWPLCKRIALYVASVAA